MSLRFAYLALPALILSGCFFDHSRGSAVCATATTLAIDTGASIDHAAGVDAGYYARYTAGGHWHLEWTCDTRLSASA